MRASKAGPAAGIPQIVGSAPLLNAPQPGSEPELFTVVAQDVPLRELLFTMARDAGINVDVHPEVQGLITLNAINQTLPQILQRIARQANIRWSFDESGNLVVEGDTPYWRTYTVDYVNVSRTAESQAQISTAIVANLGNLGGGGGGGGGGGQQGGGAGANNSRASFTQSFAHNFWATLTDNLRNLLGETSAGEGSSSSIVTNAETGIISVRATIDRSTASDPIRATLRMLSRFGELRVLSSPKIMTLNNQAAMLRVVDNEVYFNVEVEPGVVSGTGPATTPT